jgi:glycosyltransferase involved in cell wall biosynthesis
MAAAVHVALGVLAGTIGGPATYGQRLAAALTRLRDAPRLTVLTDRPGLFAALGCAVVDLPMRGGVDRLRWQHWALPRALRRLAADVYHDTKNALPRGLAVPAVVTVHDLAFRVVPATFGPFARLFLRRATADAVRRARIVVVPSAATANDVARFHPQAAPRTRIVPHGIDPAPALDPERAAAIRQRLGLPRDYVLHVGTIQARKNVDLLIRALRTLRQQGLPHRCVVVGRLGWRAAAARAELERDDTAQWLGVVDGEALAAIYAGAAAFVSPSAYEGFGFTVADALAAGVPTVISDVSSLPEVCGDAALRLPALAADAIAAVLAPLLRDEARRRELAVRGRARAATFSWARAAALHLAAYREAAGG